MRLNRNILKVVLCALISGASTISVPGGVVLAALGGNPSGVSAETKPGTASASIKWTGPTGVTRYRVKAYIGSVAVKSVVVNSSSLTSYTFTGLELDIPYTLKVAAGDATSWGTEVSASQNPVTPKADSPSAPAAPVLSVVADSKIEAKWTIPAYSGGVSIDRYSVQLKKDGENVGDPSVTTSLSIQFATTDKTSQYTVNVKAVNTAGLASPESEDSLAVVAELKAASVVATPPTTSPLPGNGNGNGNGNSTNGSSTGQNDSANRPVANTAPQNLNSTGALSDIPVAAAPSTQNSPSALQPTLGGAISYTKSVTLNSRTTKTTLVRLSHLAAPKGSKITYAINSGSRSTCSISSSYVTAKKVGRCSIKVTVQVGKKSTSRTVVLTISKKVNTASISREGR